MYRPVASKSCKVRRVDSLYYSYIGYRQLQGRERATGREQKRARGRWQIERLVAPVQMAALVNWLCFDSTMFFVSFPDLSCLFDVYICFLDGFAIEHRSPAAPLRARWEEEPSLNAAFT
jgi:hypothetical protein